MENPFSLNLIKKISHNEIFNNDNIKFYYIFLYKNKILFNFFNFRQIKLYLFDLNKKEFVLKRIKDYCKDNSNKYFYYMKRNNKFLIFKCDEAIIYNSFLTQFKTLISLEDEFGADLISSCKELNSYLLCFIFSGSISLYNINTEKFIGTISEINPKSVKLIKNNNSNFLMILSLGDINIYEMDKLTFVQKLNTNKLKNINKIKQLSNLDIGIIYGDYNLAIYDLKKNIIKFQIKNEGKFSNYYIKNYHLKQIGNNVLIYNPTRYSLHIINYVKGQVLAKFSDGLNKIQRFQKINELNIDGFTDDDKKINKFFIINNLKGYFILKVNDS